MQRLKLRQKKLSYADEERLRKAEMKINKAADLTLLYTHGLEIVVLHVMVPQPYRFSPCFLT